MTSDGRPVVTPVTVAEFPVAALALLFDDGLPVPGPGDLLPPYWQLAACAAPPRTGDLRADGHAAGGLAPAPPGLPRRMFGGGRLWVDGPVALGEQLIRESEVVRTQDKQGGSGPLRFLTLASRLRQPGGAVLLTEEQDIVYRGAPGARAGGAEPAGAGAPAGSAAADGPPAGAGPGPLLARDGRPLHARFAADAVALQRFSAATSNPHRIHYDHPYATSVEGYPGLVVHGPLLLLSLLELIRLDLPGREVTGVSFRARAPVFAGQQVSLAGEAGGDVVALAARDQAGQEVMTCRVTTRAR